MKDNTKNLMPLSLLITAALIFGFSAQPVLAAKHAAKVIYSFGDVKADSKSGSRGLKKGDMVYSGETVSTARGRAQIKFTDGGFASLQPNTDYAINEYKFEGKADGKERSFLSLLKGSVRLVTGVIGKANRKNFRIRTAVATIGIRGTQGTLSHDPSSNVTTLKGHGGEWELESGSFFGPVPAGQSYSCNGVSCNSIAGASTRSEVSRGRGKRSQREQAYQQGNQAAPDGRNCDLGGACDELTVKINQHGSFAGASDDGEGVTAGTDFLEGLGVVSVGAKPVAFLSDGQTDGEGVITVIATDIDAVKEAVEGIANDAELLAETTDVSDSSDSSTSFEAEAEEFFGEMDAGLLATLASNPASVADEDFATTDEGVTLGRIWQGNVYIATKNLYTGELDERVDTLRNFQSLHFVYGDDLQSIAFGGVGNYSLTAATYPTAIDGSMMGTMPTIGSLSWNFLSGIGSFSLSGIVFDNKSFTIAGDIEGADFGDRVNPSVNSVFVEGANASATYLSGGMSMSAPVTLDGNFFGENGNSAPLAAGLTYAVDYYSNPFVGAAAFGLTGVSSATTTTTIKYAFNRTDMGMSFPSSLSNGDDQFPMGTPLNNFTTTFGDSFNQGGASILESGSDPSTGVSWARFSSGYTFTGGGVVGSDNLLEFHAIKTDYTTPDAVIASTTGSATYTLYGATSPTIIRDIGSSSYVETTGTLSTATFAANFTTGMMTSVTYGGGFPGLSSATFALATTAPVAINAGTAALVGTLTDTGGAGTIGCMGGCALSGGIVNYGFTSSTPGGPPMGVISSFNTAGSGSNAFEISGVAFSKSATPPM